ncbi:MAG TPA: FAD-binding oxidoreductase [Bryobacteraceae bacterium]|nr:FAD-binding oxidoreductase [Bryobacteraceae bacterium]
MNQAYLEDASGYRGEAEAVYTPSNEAELCDLIRQASAANVPLTVAGAGTGVAGGRVPHGGWVVSLERFTRIHIDQGFARAGSGVLLQDLQAAAFPTGQFYAPDPTEMAASVGGSIATNASGSRSFRCGDTRSHVQALRVALMDGTVREFRRGDRIDFDTPLIPRPSTTKHSAGFLLYPGMDWVDLFIGSEGTLGVITEAELHLVKLPGELISGVVFFKTEESALDAVDAWRPIPLLRMIEFFDAGSLRLLREKYPEVPRNACAALLIEQEIASDADYDAWEARLEAAKALSADSWFAMSDADREKFRRFRHALPEAVNTVIRQRGLRKLGTDFAVPLDRSRDMMRAYREVLEPEFSGRYVIFGHIGDAHVHVNILPADEAESTRAMDLITSLARTAVDMGGTVSAEHGLGKRKRHLLAIQYNSEQIEAMLAVKHRLDPQNLLGRGTLFPV